MARNISDFNEISGKEQFVSTKSEFPSSLKNILLDDHGIPEGIEFLGCIKEDFSSWNEYKILYRFSKEDTSPESLGNMMSCLGRMIQRLSRYKNNSIEVGIQEIDTAMPDNYYVLIYVLEDI